MKHSDLVEAARRWLCKQCPVVVTEMATTGEIPDAIGWRGGFSILIECKVTRQDFLSEQPYRKNTPSSMGQNRYYLVASGLLTLSDLPDGWGLLELTSAGVTQTKKSDIFTGDKVNFGSERRLLCSAIRRVFASNSVSGVNVRCYTMVSNGTPVATLTAEAEVSEVSI